MSKCKFSPENYSWADARRDGSTVPGRKYNDLPQPGAMTPEITLPVNVTTSTWNFITSKIIWVTNVKIWPIFLSAFAKLRKATVSFVMSACLSDCRHRTIRLPLDGFSWNLIFEYFFKYVEKIQVSLKFDKNNGYFAWRLIQIFDHICSVLLIVRNVIEN
jgi:hypothetical protein